jgi:hypothetical protein
MHRSMGWVLVLGCAFAALAAQSIALSGIVSNKSGRPISGAIVTLQRQARADTTDANGAYSLAYITAVNISPNQSGADRISLNNGILSLCLTKPDMVRVELFDIQGHLLAGVLNRSATAGDDYRLDIKTTTLAAQLLVISVTIGQRVSTFRYLPIPGNRNALSFAAVSSVRGGGRLVAVQPAIDSLIVSKNGYVSKTTPISSYQGVINITLDTITLPHFSFFVTSLKALQELSGSANGFGGDFRFGKTGPGAGLKGADSICSCIAERSMPGSRAKQWRAFLSVTADENGKQVNAIDRVGNGPWYDRLGRVLALTRADLLNTRPANADPVIANDLPNEDGVPNHTPEGTTVDNHHFVTGSSTTGALYSATATCADWTSVLASSGKPRCGFSWPRSGSNGNHWISGFDAAGCVAGIYISSSGGGTGSIIGSGGGYGGFYCFALTP